MARLVDDPDAGVRARVAMRDDLGATVASRFADPNREPSPVVWRALAATRIGAERGEKLVATADRLTLLILATNPATPPTLLDQLGRVDDPEVVSTVAATRSGRSPEGAVISQVLGARSIPTRPIEAAPPGAIAPGPPNSQTPATTAHALPPPDVGGPDDEPASHRGLVVGFFAALLAVIVVVAVLALGGGSDEPVASPGTAWRAPAGSATPARPSPERGATSAAPSSASPTGGDTTPEPVTLDLTMTAQQQRFCDVAQIRIAYDAPTAYVTITDDADRELWSGQWRSGAVEEVHLIAPSEQLHAQVTTTADPDDFRPSGSVKGTFC